MKKVYVFLFEGFSDWEIAYLSPEINKSDNIELIYFSKDGNKVSSMGGLQIIPTLSLEKVNIENVDLLILPGGSAWESRENSELEELTKSVFDSGKPVAAICAATTFLGQLGILNEIKHTSNDLTYLKNIATEYSGEENYLNTFAVTDKNVITANGIAPIEFAREIFKTLSLFSEEDTEKWFQLFKNGIWKA